MRYIIDLQEGEQLAGHFLCKQKQILKSRAGKTYLSLKLQDKTGVVDGKVWDLNDGIDNFEEYDFIKIDGSVLIYQNEHQINIRRIRKSQEGEYDPRDYIPCSNKDIEEMYDQLVQYVHSIQHPHIKKLVSSFFIEDKEFVKKFKRHSAAKNVHHSYMGGLLEHTLSVVEICDFMSKRYENVNRDLLIATAMFHDMGKVEELSQFPINDYTDDGQLMGHLIIGMEMLSHRIAGMERFPRKLASLIKHAVLSHHGELEFGSPKRPKTIEAFILHLADNMDAKIKTFGEMLEGDQTQNSWIGYQKMFARNIRRTDI